MRGRFIGLAIALSAVLPAVAKQETFAVKLTNVKVDGDLSDWRGAAPVVLKSASDLSLPQNKWDGPQDLSAAGFVGWDERNLFVAAFVVDEKISCHDVASRDFKDSDYVRFYFDLDHDANKRKGRLFPDDLCLALTPTGPSGKPMAKLPRYNGEPFRSEVLSKLVVSSRLFEGGYVIEARLPLPALEVAPHEGMRMGFQFIVGDTDDGEREAEMAWSKPSNDYWYNPSAFGELKFVKSVTLPNIVAIEPDAVSLDISPRFLAMADFVEVRLLSFLPSLEISGKLLLRPLGEGAVARRKAKATFARTASFRLPAKGLHDGPFVVEFVGDGFVASVRGLCLRSLWHKALSLQARAKTPLARLLAEVALKALKEGRPDEARRALKRLEEMMR